MNAWEEKILDRQEAREEGQKEEREQSIRKMIKLCQDLAVPQKDAASRVAEMYQLEQEEISHYMKEAWNE